MPSMSAGVDERRRALHEHGHIGIVAAARAQRVQRVHEHRFATRCRPPELGRALDHVGAGSRASAAMSSSSVLTTTRSTVRPPRAAVTARTTEGTPPTVRRFLPGNPLGPAPRRYEDGRRPTYHRPIMPARERRRRSRATGDVGERLRRQVPDPVRRAAAVRRRADSRGCSTATAWPAIPWGAHAPA